MREGFGVELVNPMSGRYGDLKGVESVLSVCSIIGFKEDLGSEYEVLRSKLGERSGRG